MELLWGHLRSRNDKLPSVHFKTGGDYSFGSSTSSFVNLKCLDTAIISPNHFTISRQPTRDHPKPVYLTNNSDLGTVINGELLKKKHERRILLSKDDIGVPGAPKIYTFTDYKYPTSDMDLPESISSQYFFESAKIGAGTYGLVTVGHAVKTCEKYAVKRIKKNPLIPTAETVMMRRLVHPCIVRVHDFCYTETYKYIFMELLVESLQKRIDRSDGFLPEQEAKILFMQLSKAVAYMHSQDIVHRDIKSNNIMLDSTKPNARLKLIDFGTTKTCSALKSFVGTTL